MQDESSGKDRNHQPILLNPVNLVSNSQFERKLPEGVAQTVSLRGSRLYQLRSTQALATRFCQCLTKASTQTDSLRYSFHGSLTGERLK
jgi:hypothetical protein